MNKKVIPVVALLFIAGSLAIFAETITSHALAMRGTPKYPAGFRHFEYVNPNAPKGGMVTFYSLGTYDTFNRYGQRGDYAAGSDSFNDSLMVDSADEIDDENRAAIGIDVTDTHDEIGVASCRRQEHLCFHLAGPLNRRRQNVRCEGANLVLLFERSRVARTGEACVGDRGRM